MMKPKESHDKKHALFRPGADSKLHFFEKSIYIIMYHIPIHKIHLLTVRISRLFTGKVKEYTVFVICMLCMVLFMGSAADKITDHDTFQKGLARVPFISSYAPVIAWAVPALEAAVAILLIVPPTSRWGLFGFTGLMIIFTVYILSMMLLAEKLPCNCNLLLSKMSWGGHLLFNAGFTGLALFALSISKMNIHFKENEHEQLR
ncbi:MauE/DoxX family redox-associated membrane protein [Pararcticibacter amylolyticus]|uniref:Methylamine utilisation protein MauE domain-containing protein n=1 Tax=Pararcticibacter amylolyticus TaxID=2173175 RepID=A0A2U2P9W9_9SPHI|nr:MauE/DoxX family redox-associated membrane protein [Pararcticibacter amylolyticus]PWG78196.1 hypothetical protein DDR33_23615 [Pararcticibacter amylolyticus]